MQIDQVFRRLAWRVRCVFDRPADNDPIVIVEPGPSSTVVLPRAPSRKGRWAPVWAAAGFIAALAVLALAYGILVLV